MHDRTSLRILGLAFGIVAATLLPARAADVFMASSPALSDGGALAATYMFDGIGIDKTACGGKNISPPLAWTNAPAGTTSFAVTIFDVDGFNGTGVSHWVAYDLPATKTSLAEGEAAIATFAQGVNQYGGTGFRGFCPPHGQSSHHYVMTVYATDLPPTLAPGMTRAELLAVLDKHILRASSIVGHLAR